MHGESWKKSSTKRIFSKRKKGPAAKRGPFSFLGRRLEVEAQAELHTTRIVRAGQVKEVARPKAELAVLPGLMALNSVWLKMLKFSQRKSNPHLSLIGNFLNTPKSKLTWSGKFRVLRPTSPNVRPLGCRIRCRVGDQRSTLGGILIGREARMRVSHQIGTRAGASTVTHTGVVAKA